MILRTWHCGRRRARLAWTVVAACALLLTTLHAADQRATKKAGDLSPSAGLLRVDPLLIAEAGEVWDIVASSKNPIWPGWNASGTPLLFYLPGEQDVLVNHPRPPQGFVPYEGPPLFPGARLAVKNGPTLIDADGQNTSRDVAGVQTLVVADTLSNLRNRIAGLLRDPRPAAEKVQNLRFSNLATDHYHQLGIVVHEAFHVFQHAQAPGKGANEMALARYPVLSVQNNVGFALEGAALAEALRTADPAVFRRAAVRWLAVRNDRRTSLAPAAIGYEDAVEFTEGLATYTQYRLFQVLEGRRPGAAMVWAQGFAGYADMKPAQADLIETMRQNMTGSVVVNNDPYGTAPLRFRLYYSGMAIGVVLDRLLPTWKQRIFAPDVSLTSLVQEGLKATSAELAKELDVVRGGPDYASLVANKTKLAEAGKAHAEAVLSEIEHGTGTGVIVDYSNLQSVQPAMSFTPFGITRIDDDRIIFSVVPIKVLFGKQAEVVQTVPEPLLRDASRRLVRFRLAAPEARRELENALAALRISDGTITDLAIEVRGVTLKARKARVAWSGSDLTITLLEGGAQ